MVHHDDASAPVVPEQLRILYLPGPGYLGRNGNNDDDDAEKDAAGQRKLAYAMVIVIVDAVAPKGVKSACLGHSLYAARCPLVPCHLPAHRLTSSIAARTRATTSSRRRSEESMWRAPAADLSGDSSRVESSLSRRMRSARTSLSVLAST